MLNGVDFRDNTPWGLRLVQNKAHLQFTQVLSTQRLFVCAQVTWCRDFLWSPSWHRNLRIARSLARARLRFSVLEVCVLSSCFLGINQESGVTRATSQHCVHLSWCAYFVFNDAVFRDNNALEFLSCPVSAFYAVFFLGIVGVFVFNCASVVVEASVFICASVGVDTLVFSCVLVGEFTLTYSLACPCRVPNACPPILAKVCCATHNGSFVSLGLLTLFLSALSMRPDLFLSCLSWPTGCKKVILQHT